jgi:hypothetical protein
MQTRRMHICRKMPSLSPCGVRTHRLLLLFAFESCGANWNGILVRLGEVAGEFGNPTNSDLLNFKVFQLAPESSFHFTQQPRGDLNNSRLVGFKLKVLNTVLWCIKVNLLLDAAMIISWTNLSLVLIFRHHQ